ncbi:hypothetical protein DM02DRAFT_682611 [Periconia macrospinosa]|uniref:Uncharacterized protein n=1 Tax=Periconia macrospinosa TaxID=97972 RepID=A0A2V1DJF4_9PLEO|nr:hypothetical protein DM02DRAFT_682611 [Periconia macrospinosa]
MADRRRHVRQHARRVWYSLLPPIVLNRIRGPDDDQVPLLDTNNEDENADRRGVICMMTSEIPNGPESPLEGMPFSAETHALMFGDTPRKNKAKEDSDSEYEEHGKKRKLNKNGEPRKVRKPRGHLRQWDDEDVARALMGLVWAAGENGIRLPFDQAAQMVGQNCTASALQQAILKIHSKLNDQGAQIPKIKMNWPSKVANPSDSNDGDRDLHKADRRRRHETARKATQTCLVILKCAYKPAGGDDAEQAETTETSPGHEHHEAAPDTLGQLNLAPRGPPPNLMPTCDMFTQQTPAVEHDFMGNQFANAVAFSGTNGYIPLPPNPGNNLIDTSQTAFGMNNFGGELIQNFQFDAFYTGSNVNEPRFNNVNGEGVVSDTVSTQDQMHSSINGSDGSSFTEMFQFDAEDDRMFGGAVRNPITSPFSQTTANNLVGLGTQQPAWASHANQYRCPPENSFHVGNPYELNEYGIPYHSVRQPVWNNSHVPDQHDPEYWGNACTKVEDEE